MLLHKVVDPFHSTLLSVVSLLPPCPTNNVMPSPADATQLLDRHFLEVRARLLEVAATLDRLDRAEGEVTRDARREQIATAISILADAKPGRAERLQRLFSRDYKASWRADMQV